MKTVSFFIITYNRPDDTYSAVMNILFLEIPKNVFIEIIVVDNNSSKEYSKLKKLIETVSGNNIKIVYLKNKENLGVAGGRNVAMKKCTGDVLISLDDDADFIQKDTIQQVLDLFDKYEKDNVHALTFIEKRRNGEVFIASKSKLKHKKEELFTSFFVGCGHAFTRKVIDDVGYYDTLEKYGGEEYDMSYKMLEKGYRIVHTNNISVLHKKSIDGRQNVLHQNADILKNKSLIAYKYLPKRYFYTHLFFWTLFFLYKTKGNISGLVEAWKMTLRQKQNVKRSPISQKTITYIKEIGGRVLY